MSGRDPPEWVAVPPCQRIFNSAVAESQGRMTSTPKAPKKGRRSRSAFPITIAFGQKVPQHPNIPRTSAIKRSGSLEAFSKGLRDYPTPSLKTPKARLTMPETPSVLRNHPVVIRHFPSKPPVPIISKPQERLSRPSRRQPLRDVEVPAWVNRLSQPKRHPKEHVIRGKREHEKRNQSERRPDRSGTPSADSSPSKSENYQAPSM